jgi:Tfp pilus assembly protein PilV
MSSSGLAHRARHPVGARPARGVSLIEALVALAVLAFGMLGVIGMQSTLRMNADVAKQRAEATRLAQQAIESRRAFTALNTTAGRLAYADLVDADPESIAGDNATFVRTVTMPDLLGVRNKSVAVVVSWVDRANVTQSVRLASVVSGSLPELSVAIGLPPVGGAWGRKPLGRHPAIPPSAVSQSDGTSLFSPPGAGTVQWVFDNASGYITKTCTSPGVCSTFSGRLLSGYVAFATGNSQPTPQMAETPPSSVMPVSVRVAVTSTPADPNLDCFEETVGILRAYYCAIEVNPLSGGKWSGRSRLFGGGLSIASNIADEDDDEHKVCRYTPVQGSHPVVPTIANEEHPLNYLDVTESMSNQNFLVIRAGNDTTPFACPADDTATPFVNGNTWHHQPSS